MIPQTRRNEYTQEYKCRLYRNVPDEIRIKAASKYAGECEKLNAILTNNKLTFTDFVRLSINKWES